MPELGDVVLAGNPYAVAEYSRGGDGEQEALIDRQHLRDFVGGQHRAYQLERESSWDGLGVGPAWQGQAVQPWPYKLTHVDSVIVPVSIAQGLFACVQGDRAYVATGRYLYKSVLNTAGAWANFTMVYDAGVGLVATGICPWFDDQLAIAYGTTGDIRTIVGSSGVVGATFTGEKGKLIINYAGTLIWSRAGAGQTNQIQIRLTSTPTYQAIPFDSKIRALCHHQGKVAIATGACLYLLDGYPTGTTVVWSQTRADPIFSYAPAPEPDKDFNFLISYNGQLLTWFGNQVMTYNAYGGSTRQGWKPTGLKGQNCYGAAIAGDNLMVCIQNLEHTPTYEVWMYDGVGWWKAHESTSAARIRPISLGSAGGYDAIAFRNGDATVAYEVFRTLERGSTGHNFATSGDFYTSLLHCDRPDATKAWRNIGATFATPEPLGNSASVDTISIALAYSIDGGATFTTVAAASQADGSVRLHELSAALPSNTKSKYLQIKVFWTGVLDWAPVLQSVWWEYALLPANAPKRTWRMKLSPRDEQVRRDGSVDPRTGQQQTLDLWTAWETRVPITMRDIDYDLIPTQRNVQIIAINETRDSTKDAATWTNPTVDLMLLEV